MNFRICVGSPRLRHIGSDRLLEQQSGEEGAVAVSIQAPPALQVTSLTGLVQTTGLPVVLITKQFLEIIIQDDDRASHPPLEHTTSGLPLHLLFRLVDYHDFMIA